MSNENPEKRSVIGDTDPTVFDKTIEETRETIDSYLEEKILKEIEVRTHEVGTLSYALATRSGTEMNVRDGTRRKKISEDNGIIGDNYLAVADGMGGHEGGREASELAIELFKSAFEHQTPLPLEKWMERGKRFITEAQPAIRRILSEKEFGEKSGTTFTGAVIETLPTLTENMRQRRVIETSKTNGEVFAMILHVGDSHAYVHRKTGALELITTDEDWLFDKLYEKLGYNTDINVARTKMRELQHILEGLGKEERKELLIQSYGFTKEESEIYGKFGHIIMSAFGAGVTYEPFITFSHLLPGDRLVIVSDGLDTLTSVEKAEILNASIDAETASTELILRAGVKAQRQHTKDDDMTVVILENTYMKAA